MAELTHLDSKGEAHMVDVGGKPVTRREAAAASDVVMAPETLALLRAGNAAKGDVFAVARIAGIQAAKRTAELIPLCHPLPLDRIDVTLTTCDALPGVRITAHCAVAGRTGVEMEALTAASVAALTVYDMLKAVDRGMTIAATRLVEKRGGRSGDYRRAGEAL
ncbi:MAG TPA: cyclic pyranopterin monophosphate synthase MoaC [Pseudohaliea sp.]|nr:cyclic pyranopterin monophosphate synthase MoaC [Pseudohaliea sp.]